MNVHEQFAEDLSLYALGALQEREREVVEQHLEECSACREELERLHGDLALLAFSASGPRPPARSRARLLAAIAKNPPVAKPSERVHWTWWNMLGWAAAVAAIMLGVLLRRQNSDLRQRVTGLETSLSKQEQELLEAKQLLATLTSPDAEDFTLVSAKSVPQPQGKVIYVRGSGTVVFLASNMPAAPPQKAYELWLIPASGAPIAAGVFKPNAGGAAAVIHPPLPSGVQAKAFAITVEPEAGSSAPTSPPIMMGNSSG
jgi:anti-sigma-K factor RskA